MYHDISIKKDIRAMVKRATDDFNRKHISRYFREPRRIMRNRAWELVVKNRPVTNS